VLRFEIGLDWIGKIDMIRSGAYRCSSVVRIRSGHVGGSGLGLADLGEPRQVSLRISVRGLDFTCAFSCASALYHIRINTARNHESQHLFVHLPIHLHPHPPTQ